jgi:hypothetical protein
MEKLIISYDFGYNNWYVSEFYKYFHEKVSQTKNINLEYVHLREFSKKFGKEMNHNNPLFNWFNLIIYNENNGKMFVHSWYDYATEILNYCVSNNINLVKFSCVSNLTDQVIKKHEGQIEVCPSVYYLENWSDLTFLIDSRTKNKKNIEKIYFNGAAHGIRENIINALSGYDFFDLRVKSNPKYFKQKKDYYEELNNYKFGLSLNGAANICYRDLELFGLGVLNIRQPLNSKTHNPIIKDVHYKEFITDEFVQDILNRGDISKSIINLEKDIKDFYQSKEYDYMINESLEWFNNNCLPEKQYNIILSFLNKFDIFF